MLFVEYSRESRSIREIVRRIVAADEAAPGIAAGEPALRNQYRGDRIKALLLRESDAIQLVDSQTSMQAATRTGKSSTGM